MIVLRTLFFFIAYIGSVVAAAEDCASQGFMCRSKCTELVRCTPNGNGTFAEQVVRRCPGTITQFCNSSALDCNGNSCQDAGLDVVQLTCHENGFYPHPTDCKQYFECTNGVIKNYICSQNASYNAALRNCSGSITDRSCLNAPIKRCQSVSDIGGYPEDVAVFYVCAFDSNGYLRPEFHRCSSGYAFQTSEGRCEVIKNSASSTLPTLSTAALIAFIFAAY